MAPGNEAVPQELNGLAGEPEHEERHDHEQGQYDDGDEDGDLVGALDDQPKEEQRQGGLGDDGAEDEDGLAYGFVQDRVGDVVGRGEVGGVSAKAIVRGEREHDVVDQK